MKSFVEGLAGGSGGLVIVLVLAWVLDSEKRRGERDWWELVCWALLTSQDGPGSMVPLSLSSQL